jgi:hypothetical protein
MPRAFYVLMIRRGTAKSYYAEGICPFHLPITNWDEFQIFKTIGSMREQKYLTKHFIRFQKRCRIHLAYMRYVRWIGRNLRQRELTGYQREFVLSQWMRE